MSNFKTPQYSTKLFCEIYDEASDFVTDYKGSGLYDNNNKISDSNASVLFYLLYAQYGNSPIANYDENQFKYKLWSIIFKYGPSWEKRLAIQASLRNLSENDMREGSKAIFDHAQAMGDDNISAKTDPTKIDSKSGTYYTKSKLDGYTQLWDILRADVTNEFIGKFKVCFKQFVIPESQLLYISEADEDEQDS